MSRDGFADMGFQAPNRSKPAGTEASSGEAAGNQLVRKKKRKVSVEEAAKSSKDTKYSKDSKDTKDTNDNSDDTEAESSSDDKPVGKQRKASSAQVVQPASPDHGPHAEQKASNEGSHAAFKEAVKLRADALKTAEGLPSVRDMLKVVAGLYEVDQQALACYENAAKELQTQLHGCQKTIKELEAGQQQAAHDTTQVQALRQQLDQQAAAVTTANDAALKLQAQVTQHESKIAELQSQLLTQQAAAKAAEASEAAAKAEFEASAKVAAQELAAAKDQQHGSAQIHEKLDKAESELQQHKDQLKAANEELEKVKAEVTDWRAKCEAHDKKMAAFKSFFQ